MYEQNLFKKWLETEKANGLIDIKLYPVNTDLAEREEIFAELNSMNRAIEEKRFIQIFEL